LRLMFDRIFSKDRIFASPLVLFIAIMALSTNVYSQETIIAKGATPQARAKYLFEIGDYKNAFIEYVKLLAQDPEDDFMNWRVGLCHLYQNIDKSRSIPYLLKVIKKDRFEDEVLYDIGVAYMYNEQIDSALLFLNRFKVKVTKPERMIDVTRQIEFCENARKFMKDPVNVSFVNLGTQINSEGPDMHPFTPMDESFMVFSTKRDKGVAGQNIDFDGNKPADVFWAKPRNGEFHKAKGIGMTINTEFIEEFTGMSAFGEHVFYMIDNMEGFDDIWVTEFTGRRWEKGKTLGESVNTEEAELAATCTPDAQTLFIARMPLEQPGFGGLDVFMSKRMPGGEWSIPVNLGPTINTQYDEMYPVISHDGKTLYFASQGHKSMGGYDVYKSEWSDQFNRWERPVNLGYPINNTMDNFTYCPTDNPRHAYTAQLRPGGLGDLDIYRVIYNDEEEKFTAVVVDLEVMMGPEKPTITIHEWKDLDAGGELKWFSDEYQPVDDPRFEFGETKVLDIQNGEEFAITIIGSVGGGEVQKFTPKNFPKGDSSFVWIDTRVKKTKVTPVKIEPTVTSIKGLTKMDIKATVTDGAGKKIGTHLPNYNTGRLTFTFLPGQVYEITVDAPGFQRIVQKISVDGLGDFVPLIQKKFILAQNGLELPSK
jgi:hypothetical protein